LKNTEPLQIGEASLPDNYVRKTFQFIKELRKDDILHTENSPKDKDTAKVVKLKTVVL